MPILAFLSLGFLVGNLIGLSSDNVVTTILPLLFAFGGGSAVGFFHKIEEQFRKTAYQLIFALSISCLIGAYSGIVISEYQLLSPKERRQYRVESSIKESKYLFSQEIVSEANIVDQLYATGKLNIEDAYEELYKIIIEKDRK